MKIVVYGPERRVGVLRGDSVVDASLAYAKYLREREGERHGVTTAIALAPPDLARFIEGGPRSIANLEKALDHLFGNVQDQLGPRGETLIYKASEVRLRAPLPNAARIACAGGNFADHAAAMAARVPGQAFKGDPRETIRNTGIWGFWKIARDTAGPDGEVPYPARCTRLDYEGELAIVIGKQGRDVAAARIKDFIWGVTLLGDWSVRNAAEPGPLKFALQKNFDFSCSIGPCIVVGEGLDAFNLEVETLVNGERRQHYNTKDMVFSFGEYLEHLSRDLTFYPGDLISGGTAAGTASDSTPVAPDGSQSPARFLKPGDVVDIASPKIGTLRTRIVAKKA